ncbi:MAG: DNA cytosine methyltransferase [Actinomycetes bacterium]
MTTFKTISLFSGGMGLDIGLESTDLFEVVACVEVDSDFCETIRRNRDAGRLTRDLRVFEGDIRGISPEDVLSAAGLSPGEVDLVVGGPPCQSFSTAGRRGTVQDPRGTLLWEYLRFIDALKPKFFLMENVRGLLSAALRHRPIADRPEKGGPPLSDEEQPGSVVRLFARDLSQLPGDSYHLDIFEVNAVNYGAPQLRERAIFIGNRFNAQVDFPAPTHGQANGDVPLTLPGLSLNNGLAPWRTLGDALAGLHDPHPAVLDFSPRKKGYLKMVPPGSNWRSLPEPIQKESMGKAWHAKGGRSGWWRRLSPDLPCPTLVTMPNHASTSLCHPTETRALSIREHARIQGFPDDWEFCGTISKQYAQVGNAVPTRLGHVAGRVLGDALAELAAHDWMPDSERVLEPRVIYLQSHVRTRQWFKNGKTFVRNGDGDNGLSDYAAPKTVRRTRALGEGQIDATTSWTPTA